MTDVGNTEEAGVDGPSPAEELTPQPNEVGGKRKGKNKIKFESSMQREEAVVYFRALVDGLESGRLEFRQGDDVLELAPSETVEVSVKASEKSSKQKVTFELEWRSAGDRLEVKT